MRASLILILTIFASASIGLTANANAICLRNVNGHIFNLCPFDSPVNVNYNVMPYWSANITLGLAKANVPSCNNSTVNGWFSGVNIDGECATEVTTDPVFSYTQQITGLPVLKIAYLLDNNRGNITLNLLCNQTAPHNNNVNFFVDGVIEDSVVISGYSYYGCPVHAADKKFLSF